MAEESKIRVGLVGVGNWARYGHIPALRLLPEYEIVAVSSRRLEKAKEIGKTFGIPHPYGDKNGAMFQTQLEGGKCNQTGLQIDLTGTHGDLQITNEKAFVTKHNDIIRGAQDDGDAWRELPTPIISTPSPPRNLMPACRI
jgi:hypothetical protein